MTRDHLYADVRYDTEVRTEGVDRADPVLTLLLALPPYAMRLSLSRMLCF